MPRSDVLAINLVLLRVIFTPRKAPLIKFLYPFVNKGKRCIALEMDGESKRTQQHVRTAHNQGSSSHHAQSPPRLTLTPRHTRSQKSGRMGPCSFGSKKRKEGGVCRGYITIQKLPCPPTPLPSFRDCQEQQGHARLAPPPPGPEHARGARSPLPSRVYRRLD
ncbi:hypothetical protein IE81DRAFT_257845 [Ceraceosorus guamensis]|uniref:Uncharacterized protein n=1 Tax=Ceraceosorus guamensis TaxID=1522189 RepID=A0A316VQH1_9BASI|nr:hypothetical protein IE81DRAFT_257845 [Ceraceosorus guamensis]PWN39772.1 hypothetical protein IE81DRAFT_257845 [Ceraceosorus guamensis]